MSVTAALNAAPARHLQCTAPSAVQPFTAGAASAAILALPKYPVHNFLTSIQWQASTHQELLHEA
jgi:hypothetical protein